MEALDPDFCKARILGSSDFFLQQGRHNLKLFANAPPRQNTDLMKISAFVRDMRPGEGKLNNISELSRMGGTLFAPLASKEPNRVRIRRESLCVWAARSQDLCLKLMGEFRSRLIPYWIVASEF